MKFSEMQYTRPDLDQIRAEGSALIEKLKNAASADEAAQIYGVPYLYNFLTRPERSTGPAGQPCELADLRPGDLIQLSFDGEAFRHSPVVVSVGHPAAPENVLIAAHSYDADNRPLSTYSYQGIRFLAIFGVWRP